MENIIEIRSLRKKYKGFSLEEISFQVPRGYIMGLIGPNGAGKTTIIKLIMNLIPRLDGEIRIFGMDNIRYEDEIKARIGFVYDVPCFYEDVALRDIKSAVAPFYSRWDEKLFQSLAGEFQLPLRKKFKTLSHGMKMKFSLALALSHNADLILMDEPTTGLDPVFRRELLEKLSALIQDEKKTILFSTHITSDLERIADYITFIRDGHLVFSSTLDEIRDKWGIVKGGEEVLVPENLHLFKGIQKGSFGIRCLTDDAERARKVFAPALVERASIDEIMALMGQGGEHGSH